MNLEELMASTPPMQQHALIKGFQAGAASRDAEVVSLTNQRDYEYVRAENAEQERDQFEQERDQLRAQINILRDALQFLIATKELKESIGKTPEYEQMRIIAWGKATVAITSTPEQSLAAYRNKVIEECAAKCKDKHINGNWMYDYREECEAAILGMKEQP